MHEVVVQGDGAAVADLLQLRAREAVRAQVPEHRVVVRPVARKLVALRLQGLGEGVGIRQDGPASFETSAMGTSP